MGKSSGSIWVSLGLKTAEFQKGIKKAKGSLNGFQKFGAGLKNMFNPLTVGIGVFAGLGAAVSGAFKILKDFEKANSDLKAVLNGTDTEMASLSKQAKELGASTAFTATEVSQLQKEFAKLGFDSSQIENMTEATLNLAAAAGTDLANAASQTGSVLNAFGLNSQDAAHVTDVMALSFSSSALDIEKFSEAMKYAAPVSKAAGISVEYTTAAIGKLADANISGSQAGTALRKITSDLTKNYGSLEKGLTAVAGKLKGAKTEGEKLAIAEGEVGRNAYGALLVLADQKEALGKLSAELENADGAAKKMANTMLDNLSGDITKAGSAWEGFIHSLESDEGVLSQISRSFVRMGSDFLNFFTMVNSEEGVGLNKKIKLFENLQKRLEEGTITTKEYLKAFQKVDEGFKGTKDLDFFTRQIEALKNNFLDGGMSLEAYRKALKLIKVESDEFKKSQKSISEGMPEVSEIIEQASEKVIKLTEAQKKQVAANAAQAASQRASRGEFDKLTESIKAQSSEIATAMGRKPVAVKLHIEKPPQEEFEEIFVWLNGKIKTIKVPVKPEISEADQEAFNAKLEQTRAIAMTVGQAAGDAFQKMGNTIVDSMVDSSDAMGQFKAELLKTVVKMISMLLANAIANAIVGATSSATGTGPAAVYTMPAFIATAVGGVLGAFASIPAFAEGGIVSGPTVGLMGEYAGAKSNPEVIAPLDKLKGLIGDTGGGGMGGDVTFKIQGNELVGILKRQNKSAKFSN